jgi:hypothetical protein
MEKQEGKIPPRLSRYTCVDNGKTDLAEIQSDSMDWLRIGQGPMDVSCEERSQPSVSRKC